MQMSKVEGGRETHAKVLDGKRDFLRWLAQRRAVEQVGTLLFSIHGSLCYSGMNRALE